MSTELTLPELGENIEKGDVVRVLVAVGDTIKADQPVLELETDKATIEVPSNVAGKVSDVKVKAGDKVKVGQVILVIEADAAPKPEAAPKAEKSKPAPVVDITTARAGASAPAAKAEAAPASAPAAATAGKPAAATATQPDATLVPAAPSVRKFAREMGLDITAVEGTGPGGRIDEDDVKAHVKGGGASRVAGLPAAARSAEAGGALPDFSKWGEVESKPMSNIRRKTAEHLSVAWQAPHVTQHDKADITALEAFRASYGPRVERAGGKLTVTAILVKIVALALDRFPQFASSVDMANGTIIYKKYRHIGVAADTPHGLLVPVIRDANRKTLTEIAVELGQLSAKARDKKLGLDEMAGGVFSISNLGGIGGTSFTPIINQPEVAILGVSRGAMEPVYQPASPERGGGGGGAFVPRQMLPLSLSYDHRVIDGADAARFLRFLADALEQPLTMYV